MDVPSNNTIDSRGEKYSKIMMIGHYTTSIIAHYYASNMAAIFSDCAPGEPQTASLSHPNT